MMSRKPATARRKQGESGFALLIIFLLAASVALMMYMQMPRVAFEAQRDKEQLLIDRGEQYKRAIQMYFVQFKKYPAKIEDLENTNNMRFLRRRYIDPMTGKDEWRLIHVNAAGQLTDSLVQKPPAPAGTSGATGASGATAGSGATGTDGDPSVNAAVLARPSDRALISPNGAPPQNVDPNDPRYWPPITLTPIQTSGPTGASGGFIPGQPGQAFQPGQPGQPPQFPGQQGLPGQLAGQIPGQLPGQQQGQIPGQPGQQFTGQQPAPGMPGGAIPTGIVQGVPAGGQVQLSGQPGVPPNPAVNAINDMLRQPRQGPAQPNTGQMGAGGMAGVASMFKGPSIKVYGERHKYQEWEFIFKLNNGQPGQPGQPGNGAPNGQGSPSPNPSLNPGAGAPNAPIQPTSPAGNPGTPQPPAN